MAPSVKWLPDGKRLHLQHGPSDLIVYAEGAQDAAYEAAVARFQTVIEEVTRELSFLKSEVLPRSVSPRGKIARRMFFAAVQFAEEGYITPMIAVAGAIADEILEAMTTAACLKRAYVNNGGDIALYLTSGTSFETLMAGVDDRALGRVKLSEASGIGGIATSGRHGRSLSRGIADSVTVLAPSAALADAGATMVANAVDLKGHPAITRRAANDVKDDSDLGALPVVTGCGALSVSEKTRALQNGLAEAEKFCRNGWINAASLHLQNVAVSTETAAKFLTHRDHAYV